MECLLDTAAGVLMITGQALHDEPENEGMIYDVGCRSVAPRKVLPF